MRGSKKRNLKWTTVGPTGPSTSTARPVTLQPQPSRGALKVGESMREHMRPGTLWVLKGDMVKDEWARDEKKYKPHDLPYIVPVIFRMTGLDVMDKGTPAIYMGETRVEERDDTARGGTVRLLRGVFLIGGVRYMTFNMNEFEPASVKSIDSVVQ